MRRLLGAPGRGRPRREGGVCPRQARVLVPLRRHILEGRDGAGKATMGKDKLAVPAQQPKMDKFTIPAPPKNPTDTTQQAKDAPEDKFTEILAAIQASRLALEGQIGGLQTEVSLVRQDLRNVVDRVTETEDRVSSLENNVKDLQATVQSLSTKTGVLEYRAEEAESRARRNNIRLIGFPEGAEGGNCESFLEVWLKTWVPMESLSPCFPIERAHRALARKPPPGAPPRPIIARVLNYKDRDTVLRKARELGTIHYENQKIMLFPDYTPQVQKARKTFEAVKIKLRAMGLQYMLMFPAKLKVIHEGKTHFFSTSREAWDWATESPHIVCNAVPGWGSGAVPKEKRAKTDLSKDGSKAKRQRSRSSRSRPRRTDTGRGTRSHEGTQPEATGSDPEEGSDLINPGSNM